MMMIMMTMITTICPVYVFYPFPILSERSEVSSTAIYIMQGCHSSRWMIMLSHLYPDLQESFHGCIGFNTGSELHISMQQGWLSSLLLTHTTLGYTLDRSPQLKVTLG